MDIEQVIDLVRFLSVKFFDKQIFFYDHATDMWYSRAHCDYITHSELVDFLKETID